MKKIYKFLLLTIVASSLVFYSCETTELDMLSSPNALSPDKADANLLLNSVQLDYWRALETFNNRSAELSRIDYMFGRNYFNAFGPGTLNGPWSRLYSNMIPDIANIESLNSTDNDLSFHIGISKIMEAHVMMLMVDFLGDIVWSERNNPNEFPSPKVDNGQVVYTAAIALLDEAKVLLNGANRGTATDLYYNGSTAKWIKLANTLKMRADLTVGNYQAVVDATNVLESSADDFEFKFGTNVQSPDNRHPRYNSDYRSDGANNYQSNWLMNLMSGDKTEWEDLWGSGWVQGDPLPVSDPRRRYYFYRQTWNTPGNISLMQHSAAGTVVYPDAFGADNTDGETLQCSLQEVPTHFEFTSDEDIWCSVKLGYWGRIHGNDEGTPPDNFLRTAAGVYPAGGSFDNQFDIPFYVGGSGLSKIPHGAVGLGNGGGGAGIEPFILASYVKFMKAEAYLHLGNSAAAATNLEEGMRLSIAKVMSFGSKDSKTDIDLVPSAIEIEQYVTTVIDEFNATSLSTAVDGLGFPVTKDKMDILGEQYFIAMFGGAADGFNFIRRTGYPRTLSRSVESNPGLFPRSLLYPSNENVSNKNILQKSDLSTKVFWDSGVINPAN